MKLWYNFTFLDIEYLILYLLLISLLIFGVKNKQNIQLKSLSLFAVDKPTSIIMKAIACVFVLMGHWATNMLKSEECLGFVSKMSWYTTANIALCWFMFFSGYGLSLKDNSCIVIKIDWWKRIKKIYLPLMVVCFSTIMICVVLPDLGLEKTWGGFNKNVAYVHAYDICYIKPLIMSAFGLFDWYVSCILIFYSIFYLTLYLSRKFKINHTILLSMGMLVYNVIAYGAFGWEQAHYFRFPWIFMLGHLVAVYKNNPKLVNILTICAFIPTILIHDKIMIACFVLAVVGLLLFAVVSRRYYFVSKPLLFLGSISYFFYLSHTRIGYTLLAYIGVRSMLLWVVITILISWLLMQWYKIIVRN